MTADQADIEPDYVGEDAENRLLLCTECEAFRELWSDGTPKCQHTLAEAKTVEMTGLEWAKMRRDAYQQELERDEPRVSETLLRANRLSLASKIAWHEVAQEEPDDA